MPRGNVNVRITSDTSGLSRGTRTAEKDLSRLERSSKKSLEGVHKAAKLALGVTGLGGLAFGLKDVAEEAVKAEAEQAKLARAVHNAGIAWKSNSKAVEEHLDKLSRLSGFQKSELSASLANSVRTTGDLTKAFHLNGIAMDIARTKGLNLQGAQSLVARAYNGNLRGLKSLGIEVQTVTTQQDKLKAATVKLSDELRNSHGANKETIQLAKEKLQTLKDEATQQDKNATRVKAITILQQKFGGQSAAYAKTAAGQFDRAKASLTLAEEEIGKALLPSLAEAAKSVAKIATQFSEHWPEIKKSIHDTVGPAWSFAKAVGGFVAHHKELRDMALQFVAIAGAVKIIGGVGGKLGIASLAGAVRGGGGGGGGAGNLLAAGALAGGVGARTATGVRRLEVAGAQRFGTEFRYGAPVSQLGPRATPGLSIPAVSTLLRGAIAGLIGYDLVKGAQAYGSPRDPTFGLPTQRSFAQRLASGVGSSNPFAKDNQDDLRKFGSAVKGLGNLGSAPGDVLSNMAKQARALKKEFPGATDNLQAFGSAADQELKGRALPAFRLMAKAGGKSMTDIKQAVFDSTFSIQMNLGKHTEQGKDALAKNFRLAAAAVKRSMDAGVISTKEGTALINKYLRQALAEYGITGKQAGRYIHGQDTLTGKSDASTSSGIAGAAVGGYIGSPGESGGDNVPVMLGRGEAVLNRYQQAPVEAALQTTYGMGLDDLFSSVTRPHYMAGGGFAGLKPGIASATRRVLARFPGLSVTSTTGGTHAPGSYHYLGEAADIAGPGMDQAAAWIKSTMGAGLTEGIHNPNLSIKFGKNVSSSYWGASTWAGHTDHIHLAVAGALRAAGLGSAQIKRVLARSGLGAVSGIAQGALDGVRRGAQSALSRAIGSSGGGDTPGGPTAKGSLSFAQLRNLWIRAGGPPGAATIMAHVAEAESSGNPNAHNASGATGLWQILGAVLPGNLYDPLVNARNAVAKYRAGGLHPWDASRSVWSKYLARGGWVGMSGGGIGGQINDITGGIHANGPTPKKPKKKAAAHKKAAKKPPARTRDINPFTGKVESHTAAQWHDIRLRYKVKRRNAVGVEKVNPFGNIPTVGAGLPGTGPGLPDFSDTSGPGIGDIQDQDFSNVQGALGDVDLHVQAGDITEAQGVQQKRDIINSALNFGFGALKGHDVLELRATLGGLKDVVEDNTKALLAIKTQQAENTQKLYDVSQRQYPAIFAALMDALSGGIGGRAGLGFMSPSAPGVNASY